MKRLSLFLLLLLCCTLLFSCTEKRMSTQYWGLFDTVVDVEGYFSSEEDFEKADKLIYDTLSYYDDLFNIYKTAEFANLKTVNESGGEPVSVSRELFDFIVYLKDAYEKTDGACNAALGRVSLLWKEAIENKTLPSEPLLEKASQHCDFDTVVLNTQELTVTLTDPELRLDAGAVAKGYVSKILMQELEKNGFNNIIVNLGGNVIAMGRKNDNSPWRVGVKNPSGDGNSEIVEIQDACLITSGGYERGVSVEGNFYHHIINPETLTPASTHLSVSVYSADPATADVLSTALFVLPLDEGLHLIEKFDAEAMWIEPDGTLTKTENFPK